MNYQPTYQLDPKVPFNQDKCDIVLKEVIDEALEEFQYNPKLTPILCANLADRIKAQIKELSFDRYKIVCNVTIGERFLHSFQTKVNFLWDGDRDGYSSYSYDTPQFFCVASVYAIYTD